MGIAFNPTPVINELDIFLKEQPNTIDKVTVGRRVGNIRNIYVKIDFTNGSSTEFVLFEDEFVDRMMYEAEDYSLDILADRDFLFWCAVNDYFLENGYVCVGEAEQGLSSVFQKIQKE